MMKIDIHLYKKLSQSRFIMSSMDQSGTFLNLHHENFSACVG